MCPLLTRVKRGPAPWGDGGTERVHHGRCFWGAGPGGRLLRGWACAALCLPPSLEEASACDLGLNCVPLERCWGIPWGLPCPGGVRAGIPGTSRGAQAAQICVMGLVGLLPSANIWDGPLGTGTSQNKQHLMHQADHGPALHGLPAPGGHPVTPAITSR